ncbi:MAG TPA: aminoacyl-tRNA hydrolase, partial [Methyloceanibacter sp.]|nr:aminoacyl-tRNA hydrolase [Methyloceanibacter sp.]
MKLFVGLGNPGAEYAFNRHNVGFMAADAIASEHGFPAWRKRFSGLTAEGKLGREQVLLLKPQTYMNESGRSVGEAARFYKLGLDEVIVFHDELDLVPGKVRVKTGGGSAGHNGLRSITAHLGNDYVRVRIGIGHPGSKELVTNWVLQNFVKSDREWLEPLL